MKTFPFKFKKVNTNDKQDAQNLHKNKRNLENRPNKII